MIISAACWGLGTVMSKGVLSAMSPLTVLVIQLTSSIVFLWVVALRSLQFPLAQNTTLKKLLKQVKPRLLLQYGLPGLLEPGASYLLGLTGLSLTTASSSTLISSAEPVFVLGLSWVLLGEKIRPLLLGLSATAIVGVLLTIGVDLQSEGRSALGDLLLVAGTGCAALYVILAQAGVKHLPAIYLSAIQQSIGLIGVILIWISFGQADIAQLATIPVADWSLTISSGIVQYALAFWIYLQALETIPVSVAAQFLSLTPVFGVGGAYLFLGERLTLLQGFGMTLVIAVIAGIAQIQQ
ncbi:MAG: DMT family transporter [Waterburya sp.]